MNQVCICKLMVQEKLVYNTMHDNMISTEIKSQGWRKLMHCGLSWLLFNANISNISAISWHVGCLSDHMHMQYVVNCLSDHMHMQYVSYLLIWNSKTLLICQIYFIGISICFILVMIYIYLWKKFQYLTCEILVFSRRNYFYTTISVLSVVPCCVMVNTHTIVNWND